MRQNLQSLAALCENEGVNVEESPEAKEIKKSSTFADDVRAILRKYAPDFIRPQTIRQELEELGWDMAEQKNPLATIYSLL